MNYDIQHEIHSLEKQNAELLNDLGKKEPTREEKTRWMKQILENSRLIRELEKQIEITE